MTKQRKRLILVSALCLLALIMTVLTGILLTNEKNAGGKPGSQIQAQTNPNGQENMPDTQIPNAPGAEDPSKPDKTPDNSEKPDGELDETNSPSKETTSPHGETTAASEEATSPHKETTSASEETTSPSEETTSPSEETTAPSEETTAPYEETTSPSEETTVPPDTIPPEVVIPGGEDGLKFPCDVPGHDLRIIKIAPYSGMFVEDGTNANVKDVAMLMIQNIGNSAVEYTEITLEYKDKTLIFQITALPAGEKMVVQEKSRSTVPEGEALNASALVIHRAQMTIAPELSVTDNGDNSLTVQNLTDQTIPALRVFYKYYMEDEDLFVGGIAFTVRITGLGPKGSIVVHPSHYNSQTSRVVMALIYDTEG